jgi:hypothetical protein
LCGQVVSIVVIQVDGGKLSVEVIASGGAPYAPYAGGVSKITLDDKPSSVHESADKKR